MTRSLTKSYIVCKVEVVRQHLSCRNAAGVQGEKSVLTREESWDRDVEGGEYIYPNLEELVGFLLVRECES